MNKEKYIEKWLDGSLSTSELEEFSSTDDYAAITRIDKVVQRFKAPDFDAESALVDFDTNKKPKQKQIQFNWIQPVLRVAAVVAIIAVGYFLLFTSSDITYTTKVAEQMEITLPDKSVVILNAASSLTFNEDDWAERRLVQLYGEGYFKVAKGARFDVETEDGNVAVLGTQFNVKVRNDYFEVVCYEGLVGVEAEDAHIELAPNQMFRVIDGKQITDNTIIDLAPSWIANESAFISVPFGQIVDEFERQYAIKITTKNVDLDQLFTGRFTHKDLDLGMKSIALPMNLNYEVVDDKNIVLSGDIE
jgi:transmembrane sensor